MGIRPRATILSRGSYSWWKPHRDVIIGQGLSHLCVQCVIWTPRTLYIDSLDTQKFRSGFTDDDNSRR